MSCVTAEQSHVENLFRNCFSSLSAFFVCTSNRPLLWNILSRAFESWVVCEGRYTKTAQRCKTSCCIHIITTWGSSYQSVIWETQVSRCCASCQTQLPMPFGTFPKVLVDFPPLSVSAVMLSKVVMSSSCTCCVRTCSCQTSTLAIEIVHDLNRRHHCHVCDKSAETFTLVLCRHVCVPLDGGASRTLQGSAIIPAEIRWNQSLCQNFFSPLLTSGCLLISHAVVFGYVASTALCWELIHLHFEKCF